MKKLYLMIILGIFVLHLFAEPVDFEIAQKIAEMKLYISNQKDHSIDDDFELKADNENILSYVFHLNPNGFIAISSDTDITPVIAYSFRNDFSEEDVNQNIGYQLLKEDMQLRLSAIPLTSEIVKGHNRFLWDNYINGNIESFQSRDDIWPPEGYSPTGGWVETQWNQSPYPYWIYCPIDPTDMERCPVGCVATGMVQIMHYHRYIGDVSFDDSDDYYSIYTNPMIHIDDDHELWDFASFPELNPPLDDLKDCYEANGNITDEMIAALCFGTGVAVEMNYASDGSGSNNSYANAAFLNKFDYESSNLVSAISDDFYDDLINEMIEARPVLLSVIEAGAPYGHALIVDGYNGTDDTYHLNLGWGGYCDGWYTLPSGMPEGFNVINSAVINIEDGNVPFLVNGQVFATGVSVEGAYITLDGDRFYDCHVDDPTGYFEMPYVYEGTYIATAIIELEEGGYFYKSYEAEIDAANNLLLFFMDSYETITGTVSGPVSTENSFIAIYQNDELLRSSVTNASGEFSVPGLLPGEYAATASLGENYFDSQEVTITADNQTIDFVVEEYPYDTMITFAGEPTGTLQLGPNLTCAIKLANEDIAGHTNDVFSKVEFIAPFNPEDGELFGQLWRGDLLISEIQIEEFYEGEWLEVIFDNFALIDVDEEYYIGSRIHSFSGPIPASYHDDGPRVEGKGAFIRTSSWMELTLVFDYNFCIKATVLSQTSNDSDENEITVLRNNLENNFPNPFNPTTMIKFNIKKDETGILSIYNIKGQLLESMNFNAGTYTYRWDAQDYSSGIYFYKLQTSTYSQVKKMIMMK